MARSDAGKQRRDCGNAVERGQQGDGGTAADTQWKGRRMQRG
ncbi:hypothetical protein [Sphingobacterium detergens]|nr:hypothetical protein [Sphingobacterium detergens]